MKKQILSLLVLIISVSATAVAAEKKDPRKPVVKQVKLKEAFHKLIVKGNVDVILFEDTTCSISIIGNRKSSEAVQVKEANGVLTIQSNNVFAKRVQVTVPVHNLCTIDAGEFSSISTVTMLESPELTILVNDGCKAGVRNTGIISIVNGTDTEDCRLIIDEEETGVKNAGIIHIVNGIDTEDCKLITDEEVVVQNAGIISIVNGKDTEDCLLVADTETL